MHKISTCSKIELYANCITQKEAKIILKKELIEKKMCLITKLKKYVVFSIFDNSQLLTIN